jgi:hypothetical protein
VERQYGSSEEEERWQTEQSRPQRIGEKGSSHTRSEQGGARSGAEETQIGRFEQN